MFIVMQFFLLVKFDDEDAPVGNTFYVHFQRIVFNEIPSKNMLNKYVN